MSENSTLKTINEVNMILNQLTAPNYRIGLQNINTKAHGKGQPAIESIKKEFNEIDFSLMLEFLDLEAEIKKRKEEISHLEKKHSNLKEIIGIEENGNEGSIANKILDHLQIELDNLIEKRDNLSDEVRDLEKSNLEKLEELKESYKAKELEIIENYKKHKADYEITTKNLINAENQKVSEAVENARGKVKLINQFRDFLEETNNNMRLYSGAIILLIVLGIVAVGFSIPSLLESFSSFDYFILLMEDNVTNWQILNYAFGLLIVKLPWALCISVVFTGMYSLLKGLLTTYEKINQDKRNMSAIYAISGNVAQQLNEYGLSLTEEFEDEETGKVKTVIEVNRNDLNNKRENIRWNQIMRYFERLEHYKLEIETPEDPTKVKLLKSLLDKIIERLPKN